MQKILKILLGLTLSQNVFALDAAVENIQALCGLAKQGKYSEIQGKAQLQADGSVKLATLGGKGEISFSKGEWDGVSQVLQAHQAGNLKDYRACVANALPYFKSKVVTPAPAKSTSKPAAKTPVKPDKSSAAAKPVTPPPPKPTANNSTKSDADINVETHGEKSPAINGDGATVNYN